MAFQPTDIVPWVLPVTMEHDGVEIYALYLLMFLNIAVALALSGFLQSAKNKRANKIHKFETAGLPLHSMFIVALSAVLGFLYLRDIGFVPPENSLMQSSPSLGALSRMLIIAAAFIWLAFYLQKHADRWTVAVVALILSKRPGKPH